MSDNHEPWCDSQLGPDFEVAEGEVRMTIHVCLGCKGEPAPESCPDKSCAATSAAGCRYPHWMLCGHPVERPTRTAALTAEPEPEGAAGGGS